MNKIVIDLLQSVLLTYCGGNCVVDGWLFHGFSRWQFRWKSFDPTKLLYRILFISMLQIWNFKYSRYFWIIKCVGLGLIIFAINLCNAPSQEGVRYV